jgi:RHS repeat-associated protein
MQNRIMKAVKTGVDTVFTFYVRDAQGNVLGVYTRTTAGTPTIKWAEQYIYGSGRLGSFYPGIALTATSICSGPHYATTKKLLQGQRRYELSNHLGNILATINDRRIPRDTKIPQDNIADYYDAVVLSAQDYYPFGMEMPGRTFVLAAGQGSRYGFNGKEKDPSEFGSLTHYDYGFRIYNPALGRFLSVDPMTKFYPAWSPYPFAMNRPIDGVDKDGLEWDQATDDNGKTSITVNVNFKVDDNLNLSVEQIESYQDAISAQMNSTLMSSSNETVSASVSFNGGNGNGRLVPNVSIYGTQHSGGPNDPMIGGLTSNGSSSINIFNKDGSIKSPEDLAIDAVHELLHTLRFEHPFEQSQGADTKLISTGKNRFESTPTTDPNISCNIMNYNLINIDGQSLKELWQTNSPTLITKDQIGMMLNEINLQIQGYGVSPKYDSNLSHEENSMRYFKYYKNYWESRPGEPVEKKE